jgi:protein CLEC16A
LDALDLNTSDLIACTVKLSSEKRERRFLVIDPIQFILVEPEVKRIGWGVVKFSDLVQNVEVAPDKEDSRSFLISIKKCGGSSSSQPASQQTVRLNSVFTFDDHIRCMAAKQHLVRARDRARRMKLEKIAQLLDIVSASANNSHTTKNFNSKSSSLANAAAASDCLSRSVSTPLSGV